MRILHVASEAHPLIKTGGLADVSASLSRTQAEIGHDVRLLIPAYGAVTEASPQLRVAVETHLPGLPGKIRILEPGTQDVNYKIWLLDYGPAFDRAGNPYVDEHGAPWYDNAERFHLLCLAAVAIVRDKQLLGWTPDVVHCHDWQTGLIAPLLADEKRVTKIFTIHNLSYQGIFARSTFLSLRLPETLWGIDGIEFKGYMSFIKGGIVFSDWITTVSPTYARQIQTSDLGYGLEGLLQHRAARLVGVLNGIDYEEWDPRTDPHIEYHYDADDLDGKRLNKKSCIARWGLRGDENTPLFGFIGRLVEQKGVDLLIEALPTLLQAGYCFVILGTGDRGLEKRLREIAQSHRHRLCVHIGYDEKMSHEIEAAADVFLMPSRFEPCGLNQMYSQRYGTVPVVHHTGGLADTVVPVTPENLAANAATGITFSPPTAEALISAAQQAVGLYRDPRTWRSLVRGGMRTDFSWRHSARAYLSLYQKEGA